MYRPATSPGSKGVQLLCLIDKAADACRYLQTYGEWNRAAWLAKVRLNSEECADVLKRWVDHLCSPQVNQKSKALLVLLSLGCFSSVAETLHRYARALHGQGPVMTHFTLS